MSNNIDVYHSIHSNTDEEVKIMARKPTKQKGGAEMQSTTATTQGNTAIPNRKVKFYDDILNCRLRELMDGREAKTEELANAVGISSSGVRMWYTGYARPNLEKIPIICKFYGVSADWLLGLSDAQSVNMEFRQISEETGLTDQALLNLTGLNSVPERPQAGDGIYSHMSAKEMLWLINRFIEEIDTVYTIADKANAYVNIRNAVEDFEVAEYDEKKLPALMELGAKTFGMTFNFTHGKETVGYLSYMIQREFLEFIEGIAKPAWVARPTKNEHKLN